MPSFLDYQSIINSFKSKRLTDREIEQHLSDLMLFYDFSASLHRVSESRDVAELLLLTLMGYSAPRRSVFLCPDQTGFVVLAAKGFSPAPTEISVVVQEPYPDYYLCKSAKENDWDRICSAFGMQALIPVLLENRLLGIVGLGERRDGRDYSLHNIQIMISLAQMCAGVLESSRNQTTLQSLNRELSLKIYQLNTLFELSKDFNALWDSETIFRILGSSLIGQLLVSRCAVFTLLQKQLQMQFLRGYRFRNEDTEFVQEWDLDSLFGRNPHPVLAAQLPPGSLNDFCKENQIHVLVPMLQNDELRGVILLGEKRNEKPFQQEDYDFMTTIGNLALVSDENARMQQEMIEKHRMEKELTIARDIQRGLLPQFKPEVKGYEIASVFEPCYQVGGDYFDFLPVSDHELALAIGDVSGKSTPAAMIMASLQASLRALVSMQITDPKFSISRINQLLCESQRSNKYVTFFYGVLNYRDHRLHYVNAGHCYPLIVRAGGEVFRLETGGTILGFFQDATYNSAVFPLEPGDVMILYTDGVSESINEAEEEFGVERIVDLLRQHRSQRVVQISEALTEALQKHRGTQQQPDDITFILLKRQ